ncbi:hypothetical protein FOA52_007755 [Chlamydomonas sp. UWO 241]|nr:hypothetical protein FOA52_007755 [Chlamydomonas sp. UWO 241]
MDANGGGGMPDLQLRMSKKIAQLTKVIYHLNNKNEDNDMDMQDLVEHYETEIEAILGDTNDKVAFFKAQLAEANDTKRIQDMHQAFESKYEDEKRRCLTELENVRKRASEREVAIQRTTGKQVDSLAMQVEQVHEQLQARVHEIQNIGSDAASSSSELQATLHKARQETEEAIQAGNRKYNDMLAERMKAEDALTEQVGRLSRELEAQTFARGEAESTLSDRMKQWEGERAGMAEAAAAAAAVWAVAREGMERRLAEELEAARGAVAEAAAQDARAADEAAALTAALAASRDEVTSLSAESVRLGAELAAAREAAAQVEAQLSAQLTAAEEQVAALNASAAGDGAAARAAAAAARAELDRLSSELQAAKSDLSAARSELQKRSQLSEVELAELRAAHERTVQQLKAKTTGLEDDLMMARQSGATGAASASEAARAEMQRRLGECADAHAEALAEHVRERDAALADAAATAASARDALRASLKDEAAAAARRMLDGHEAALADAAERAREAATALQRDISELTAKFCSLEEALSAQRMRAEAAESDAASLRVQLNVTRGSGESTTAQLQAQLRDLASAGLAVKAQLDAMACAHEVAVRDSESHASTIAKLTKGAAELTATIAGLRRELADEKAARTADTVTASSDASREMARLETEWGARADGQVKAALESSVRAWRAEMDALRRALSSEGANAAAHLQARMRTELTALEEAAALAAADTARAHDKAFAQALADAETARTDGEGALKRQMDAALAGAQVQARADAALADARSEAAETAKGAAERARQELADAEACHRAAVEAAAAAAATQLAAAAAQLAAAQEQAQAHTASLAQAAERAEAALKAQHAAALTSASNAAAGAEGDLRRQLGDAERGAAALTAARDALKADVDSLRSRVEQLTMAMANAAGASSEVAFAAKQAHADEVSRLRSLHTAEVGALSAAASEEAAALRQALLDAVAAEEARMAELQAAYSELKQRFDAREPREEDVALIRQLQTALSESEERVRTAEERMVQLRKELLLREDNYNKHFKNGGAGEKVLNVDSALNGDSAVMGWMLNKKDASGRKGSAKGTFR